MYAHMKNIKSFTIFCVSVCVGRNGGKMEHKLYGELRVAQYTKDGQLIKIWNSQLEASECTGISNVSISQCCNAKIKTAGGYRWSFI